MIKKLINPFKYIAGTSSLIAGVFIIILTAVIGFLSKTHFPDTISIKISPDLSIWYYIIQCFSNWIVFSIIIYLAALLFSKSSVRVVDIFGTQALARFPYIPASFIGFSDSLNRFGEYILWKYLQKGEPVDFSFSEGVYAILLMIATLALTIWLIVLMYNAFKVSSNIKGSKSVILFIISLIISIIATSYISKYLFLKFS